MNERKLWSVYKNILDVYAFLLGFENGLNTLPRLKHSFDYMDACYDEFSSKQREPSDIIMQIGEVIIGIKKLIYQRYYGRSISLMVSEN